MLEKRDRGRGADADLAVHSYGAARVHSRVEGAELLQVPSGYPCNAPWNPGHPCAPGGLVAPMQ